MASRKVRMSKWKQQQQGQRRSPRLSASDASKSKNKNKAQQSRRVARTSLAPQNHQRACRPDGPASRTRARKKKKLRPLDDVATTTTTSLSVSPFSHQGSDQQSHDEDHPNSSDQTTSQGGNSPKHDDKSASSVVPSTKWMPEKRVLELILDKLQRRDTHEIFAEPVDPEEVEDYYEIIKEPMDFGTMRAKLHEGMYISLQQFEHDVHLISKNAMHFNSSSTIYFRQARAIGELAQKVFHALKTDPKNLEVELLERRRRTSKRPTREAKAPTYGSSSKPATNLKPNSKSNISSKTLPCSLHNSSNLRKSNKRIRGNSTAANGFNSTNHEVYSGALVKKDILTGAATPNNFGEADRYRTDRPPWTSTLSENESIVSTVYGNSKPLIQVNQQDIGYRDSLMLFVKDLGPVAQMVAKRKLIGCSVDWTTSSNYWFEEPKSQNFNPFRSEQRALPILDSPFTALSENLFDNLSRGLNVIDKVDSSHNAGAGEKADLIPNAFVRVATSSNKKKLPVSFQGYVGAKELNLSGQSSTPISMVETDCYNQVPQFESSSAKSQENMSDWRTRNSYKLSPLWPPETTGSLICSETNGSRHCNKSPVTRNGVHDITAQDEVEVTDSVEAELKARQTIRQGSQFIFDLPFLKKQLDQINSSGKDQTFLQSSCTSIGTDSFPHNVNWKRQLGCSHEKELSTQTYHESYRQSSLDAQHGDLALQL